MQYDYTSISIEGLYNVLHNNNLIDASHPVLTKPTLVGISESALESGELDEIELILEESGE